MNPEPIDISVVDVPALPEDSFKDNTISLLNSDTDFLTLIHRWQPMGYRVVINLPFVSDDINPLFAIKVTPYIHPAFQTSITNSSVFTNQYFSNVYPSPSTLSSTSVAVTCTRYDNPPTLAAVAAAHRFWRGSMKYRMRCVSNFIAQGYVILVAVKGMVAKQCSRATQTLKTNHRPIQGIDTSAKRFMCNSYEMSDISFFRHNEVTVPFEYPVPFYDTYRNVLEEIFDADGESYETNCPDTFVVAYNRGGITSPTAGAQVVYELEYCPGDDLTFSQQFLYSRTFLEVNNFNVTSNVIPTLSDPPFPYTYPAYTVASPVPPTDPNPSTAPKDTTGKA